MSLEISYLSIWVIVLAQAFALKKVLRETAWLRGFENSLRRDGAHGLRRRPAPPFSAKRLWSEGQITLDDVKGSRAMLMFVSPEVMTPEHEASLSTSVYGVWNKGTRGAMYLICRGAEDGCRNLFPSDVTLANDGQVVSVPVLTDPSGELSKQFHVFRYPSALRLDKTGHIVQHGYQSVGDG